MTDSVFRSAPEPVDSTIMADGSDHKANNIGAKLDPIEEPLEGSRREEGLLNTLGIPDELNNLAPEDRANLKEATDYISKYLSHKGVPVTASTMRNAIDNIKLSLGMDFDISPNLFLERLGKLSSSYRDLAFISDPKERRSVFMKLARQPDNKSIDRVLFDEMSRRNVWQ